MKWILGLVLSAATLALVSSQSQAPSSCPCSREWDPQCGADLKTYSNECSVACDAAGVELEVVSKVECATSEPEPQTPDEGCFCPLNFDPVCGSDGNTYSNTCTLACNKNVKYAYSGACRAGEGCVCTTQYDPVCGTDGNTYGSACSLACLKNNVTVAYSGECRAPCVCTDEYSPVCGKDGNTYGNRCQLKCAKVTQSYTGACLIAPAPTPAPSGGCFCTKQYDPVCGTDKKTYGNSCSMGCAGATLAYKGACGGGAGAVRGRRGGGPGAAQRILWKPYPYSQAQYF